MNGANSFLATEKKIMANNLWIIFKWIVVTNKNFWTLNILVFILEGYCDELWWKWQSTSARDGFFLKIWKYWRPELKYKDIV